MINKVIKFKKWLMNGLFLAAAELWEIRLERFKRTLVEKLGP